MDDPSASGALPLFGTFVYGISGDNVVGTYVNGTGAYRGFLATPIPQLAIAQSGNGLNISWPYDPLASWTLQQNPDLTTTTWTPSGGIVTNDGMNNFVTITPSAGNLFYRLSQQ